MLRGSTNSSATKSDARHGDPAASTTPTGQTGLHNLGPMTGYHHRVKTHAGWQLHQPIPGIYLWVAPHGSIYLVDHTGTRQLRGPGNHPHTPEPSQPPHYTPQPPTIRLYTTPDPAQASHMERHLLELLHAV